MSEGLFSCFASLWASAWFDVWYAFGTQPTFSLVNEFLQYFTTLGSTRRVVMFGCILLGLSSGVLGSFALLRRQSLLGDAMAHAALPGVCLAFLITQTKNTLFFLLGAISTGVLGAWLISVIVRETRIKMDTAIGLILSVFFGVGIVLLSAIQKSGVGNQSGMDRFLFGKAAFLLYGDLYIIAAMCFLLLVIVSVFFKEFKMLSFDPSFAASLGFPIRKLDLFLTSLIVLAVMIGLQAVGVILMAALLILPAAAARQWTERLSVMLVLSGLIGALTGGVGAFLSTILPKLPTGPVMVLSGAMFLFISLFFARKRGLLPAWLRRRRVAYRVQSENVLKALYHAGEKGDDWSDLVRCEELFERLSLRSKRKFFKILTHLRKKDFVVKQEKSVQLSSKGLVQARRVVRNHRLWELYLTRKADIAIDHVHRDADEMEHFLSPELVEQLEALLEYPEQDPHGSPIPKR